MELEKTEPKDKKCVTLLCKLINGVVFSVRLQAHVFKRGGEGDSSPPVENSAESAEPSAGFQISWLSSMHSTGRHPRCVVLPLDPPCPPKPASTHPPPRDWLSHSELFSLRLIHAVFFSWNYLLPDSAACKSWEEFKFYTGRERNLIK